MSREKLHIVINLGDRIKKIRTDLKLNQTEMAKALNLTSPTTISQYEMDKREPDLVVLTKIAEIGGKTLDWLITGRESKYLQKETAYYRQIQPIRPLEARQDQIAYTAFVDPLEEMCREELHEATKDEKKQILKEIIRIKQQAK